MPLMIAFKPKAMKGGMSKKSREKDPLGLDGEEEAMPPSKDEEMDSLFGDSESEAEDAMEGEGAEEAEGEMESVTLSEASIEQLKAALAEKEKEESMKEETAVPPVAGPGGV